MDYWPDLLLPTTFLCSLVSVENWRTGGEGVRRPTIPLLTLGPPFMWVDSWTWNDCKIVHNFKMKVSEINFFGSVLIFREGGGKSPSVKVTCSEWWVSLVSEVAGPWPLVTATIDVSWLVELVLVSVKEELVFVVDDLDLSSMCSENLQNIGKISHVKSEC